MNFNFNYVYLDFKRCLYDSDISIWLSVDPLAAKYPHQSNYMYCSGNPVMRIDPDGMDEWEVNKKTGEVKWIKESEKHQLYVVNNKGKRTGNFVEVKNRDVLDQLTTKDASGNSVSKDHTTGSIDDVFKVFKFCSDNTSVEWGLARYNENKYAVYTSHKEYGVTAAHNLNLGKVVASMHSHPDISTNYVDEMYSMGAEYVSSSGYGRNAGWNYTPEARSDWRNKNTSTSYSYPNYVYMPNSGNMYSVNKGSIPSLIRQVRTHNQFYFGVLNHK